MRKSPLRVVDQDAAKAAAEAETAGMPADALDRAEGAVQPEPEPDPAPTPAVPAPAPSQVLEQPSDASFPSPHVIYLGVVKNELDAQLMRFKNGLEMLTAKIKGSQTVFEDSIRSLDDEYKRKRQELEDTRLSEVTRLQVQIGDVRDVIETYDAAIAQATDIADRQEKADAAAAAAGEEFTPK